MENKKIKNEWNQWPIISKSIFAGSAAGMTSVIVCHPFDTIRTRLQISPHRFNGFFHCVKKTIAQESIVGLYKGFWPPFFSQAIYKSVIFTVSTKCKTDILPNCEFLKPYTTPSLLSLLSGAIAGGVNAFLVTPVELIRNRLQVQYENEKIYRSSFSCLRSVIQTEGLLALWKGLSTTIIRDSLGVSVYFLGFDYLQTLLQQQKYYSLGDSTHLLLAGSFGGICFWSVALPFDTIKSLIQVKGKDGKYTSLHQTSIALVNEFGISHLFRGWQAAFSRGIPSAAITFYVYDKTIRLFD